MKIALDFADSSREDAIPQHGWAKNSQGVKLLWLPVIRLMHEAYNIRKAKGLTEVLTQGQFAELGAFAQVVDQLTLTLRELAKCIRIGSDPGIDQSNQDQTNTGDEAASLEHFQFLCFAYPEFWK